MKQDIRLPRPQLWSEFSYYSSLPDSTLETAVEADKEGNKMILERVTFHLVEAMRLYSKLDLSGLGSSQEKELTMCKNALEFTKESIGKLNTLFDL